VMACNQPHLPQLHRLPEDSEIVLVFATLCPDGARHDVQGT
jgi:hypothetical protein